MVDNFEEEIAKILDERPDLKEKDELKVLVSMGAYHTMLRHKFTERGLKSDQHFPQKPHRFDYLTELERALAYGIEPSQDLVKRATIQKMFEGLNFEVKETITSDNLTLMIRELISRMTDDEMVSSYRIRQKNKLSVRRMNTMFKKHGLQPMPWSNEDIERQISPYGKTRKIAQPAMRSMFRRW